MLAHGVTAEAAVLFLSCWRPHYDAFTGDEYGAGVEIRKHRTHHFRRWFAQPIAFGLIGARIGHQPVIDSWATVEFSHHRSEVQHFQHATGQIFISIRGFKTRRRPERVSE